MSRIGKENETVHELGILVEIIKTVDRFAVENRVNKIEKLVLQMGEISGVMPEYMKKIYPIAVEGSILEKAELEIEILPANARCLDCEHIFHGLKSGGICPECGSRNMKLVSGRESVIIKQIECTE